VGGIWLGKNTDAAESAFLLNPNIVIFTTDSGRFRLVSETAVQAAGSSYVVEGIELSDDDDLMGDITAYAPTDAVFSDGFRTSECNISGIFMNLESITDGLFTCAYSGKPGTFGVDFEVYYNFALYERTSSLSRVNGEWSGLDFGTTQNKVVFTLTATDGILAGKTMNGCEMTGTIAVIDPAFNMYDITLQLDKDLCAGLAGNYTGLAILDDRVLDDGLVDSEDLSELTYQIDNSEDASSVEANGSIIITEIMFRDESTQLP
jgi:hypothetical protein